MCLIIPEQYKSSLGVIQTQQAIKDLKDYFEQRLSEELKLTRVSSPLFVLPETGTNDNLNGVEKAVNFNVPNINKNVEIVVNDEKIDYEKYINTELSEKSMVTIEGYRFEINLVVWQESISEKFCCYYFDDKNVLKGNRTTTFNRNTVNFNHSVFVKSEFFDDKENVIGDHNDTQINMFEYPDEKKILKKLHKEIQMLIEKKISVYLSDKAEEAVEAMITERKTFPEFPDDVYGQMRKNDLKRVTKEIFKLEPLIFHKLKQIEYSVAAKPSVRKNGNHLSG